MKGLLPSDLIELQKRMGCDDEIALKILYDCYGNKFFLLAYAIVRSKEIAEEIVEDVFIKIWKKRSSLKNMENFSFYMYVMTKNISKSYLRKYSHKKHIDLDDAALPYYQIDTTPEDLMITREIMDRINKGINELPPKCRIIFKLVKEDGLKYKEVAELLHLHIKTVENQIGIALKKINVVVQLHLPKQIHSSK